MHISLGSSCLCTCARSDAAAPAAPDLGMRPCVEVLLCDRGLKTLRTNMERDLYPALFMVRLQRSSCKGFLQMLQRFGPPHMPPALSQRCSCCKFPLEAPLRTSFALGQHKSCPRIPLDASACNLCFGPSLQLPRDPWQEPFWCTDPAQILGLVGYRCPKVTLNAPCVWSQHRNCCKRPFGAPPWIQGPAALTRWMVFPVAA